MEVRASFQRYLVALLTEKNIGTINPLIGNIYGFLVKEQYDEMIFALTQIFSGIPYPLHIEDEKFYHALLQTIFSASGIETQSERMTSIGRMDLILELPNVFYVIELKVNHSPKEGLKQIDTQKYYEAILHKGKPVRALAISFLRKKANKKENSQFVIRYAVKE